MMFIFAVPVIASIVRKGNPVVYVVSLSLTAGLAQETSHYGCYRRTRAPLEDSSLHKGALVGISHGGIETVVLDLQGLFGTISLFFAPRLLPAQLLNITPDPTFISSTLSAVSSLRLVTWVCHCWCGRPFARGGPHSGSWPSQHISTST